jgi:hypothetical protein
MLKQIAECISELLFDIFSNNSNTTSSTTLSVEEETYNYWINLSSCEQEYYFNNNYKLQEYGDKYFYTDRKQLAKSVADIARRERRAFNNKYDKF